VLGRFGQEGRVVAGEGERDLFELALFMVEQWHGHALQGSPVWSDPIREHGCRWSAWE
jgi:hypothetical protein